MREKESQWQQYVSISHACLFPTIKERLPPFGIFVAALALMFSYIFEEKNMS